MEYTNIPVTLPLPDSMTHLHIGLLTDEQLAAHIKMLDAKARAAQSELAHVRRLLKKRKKEKLPDALPAQ